MRVSASAMFRACLATFALTIATGFPVQAQVENFTPVTDAMLENPDPADWLNWRRTLDGCSLEAQGFTHQRPFFRQLDNAEC